MRIVSGNTTSYIYFVALDSTDFVSRETALATFTVYRSRNGGVAAVMTTPTINETDTTNAPGVYELLLDEDTTISGTDSEEMVFHITHAGMAPVTRTVELYPAPLTVAGIADGVWDEDITGHLTGSKAGEYITATLLDTGTTIPAQITALNDLASSDILTTQLTESYAADGVAPTLAQAIFLMQQFLYERATSGTTVTVKEIDGATTAATLTLDSATAPTSITRAS